MRGTAEESQIHNWLQKSSVTEEETEEVDEDSDMDFAQVSMIHTCFDLSSNDIKNVYRKQVSWAVSM